MIDNNILFPQPIQAPRKPAAPAPGTQQSGGDSAFSKVLDQKLTGQPVRFSQHALERLKARGITLSEKDLKQLSGAVDSVAQKGGKESLVMTGDAALVVSIKNRTVVTALDRQSMNGHVFTNIDSAVVF